MLSFHSIQPTTGEVSPGTSEGSATLRVQFIRETTRDDISAVSPPPPFADGISRVCGERLFSKHDFRTRDSLLCDRLDVSDYLFLRQYLSFRNNSGFLGAEYVDALKRDDDRRKYSAWKGV